MSPLVRFGGNCPRNVSRDAKYTVRRAPSGSGLSGLVVGLVYEAEEEERWHPCTDQHPQLVQMVNDVKEELTGATGGAFYINEYGQVLVPAAGVDEYYLAGEYHGTLRFEFEGHVLTGEPVDVHGASLSPGARWMGPHPGVPYVLAGNCRDIYFESTPRPLVTKKVKLSRAIGAPAALAVARMITAVKGIDGGRFYVNEHRAIFTPLERSGSWEYIYVGQLDPSSWFPKVT